MVLIGTGLVPAVEISSRCYSISMTNLMETRKHASREGIKPHHNMRVSIAVDLRFRLLFVGTTAKYRNLFLKYAKVLKLFFNEKFEEIVKLLPMLGEVIC